jgi:uncharacterized membrane protein
MLLFKLFGFFYSVEIFIYLLVKLMSIIKNVVMIMDKKAQLGIIEMKFLLLGLLIGIVLTIVLAYLANHGILPFKLSFLCAAAGK